MFSQCGPRAVLTLLSSVTMQLKGPSHLDTLHTVTRAHCISDIMECDLEKQEAASMLEAALRCVSSAGLRSPHGHLFRNRWSTACWDILCEGKNR